ncbi:MAG: hypothetical protein PHC53_02880 [Patescibacteria group bacterium]|nr:hypothetical protein [Patescibacteria group bacterium]
MIGAKSRSSNLEARISKAKAPGFTVVELLVVMVLFTFSLLILTQTYLTFIRLSHRTSNSATIQQDMRFVMEYMARSARNGAIDYPAPPLAIDAVTSTLRLKAENQLAWMMRKSQPGDVRCGDAPSVSCLLVSSDDGANWAPITSKGVNVEKFNIYVRPSLSPFVLQGGTYSSDQQPYVSVQVKMTFNTPIDKEKVSMEAQTTVSSRVYVR